MTVFSTEMSRYSPQRMNQMQMPMCKRPFPKRSRNKMLMIKRLQLHKIAQRLKSVNESRTEMLERGKGSRMLVLWLVHGEHMCGSRSRSGCCSSKFFSSSGSSSCSSVQCKIICKPTTRDRVWHCGVIDGRRGRRRRWSGAAALQNEHRLRSETGRTCRYQNLRFVAWHFCFIYAATSMDNTRRSCKHSR